MLLWSNESQTSNCLTNWNPKWNYDECEKIEKKYVDFKKQNNVRQLKSVGFSVVEIHMKVLTEMPDTSRHSRISWIIVLHYNLRCPYFVINSMSDHTQSNSSSDSFMDIKQNFRIRLLALLQVVLVCHSVLKTAQFRCFFN